MMFVGGDTELEPGVRRVNRLRHEVPEIRYGKADYDSIRAGDDRIFAVARTLGGQATLVLVNLSKAPVTITVTLAPGLPVFAAGQFQLIDAWQDEHLAHGSSYAWGVDDLASFEVSFAPYGVRVLMLRPAV